MFVKITGDAEVLALLQRANQGSAPPWQLDPSKPLGFEKQLSNLKRSLSQTYMMNPGLEGFRLRLASNSHPTGQGPVLDLRMTPQQLGLTRESVIYIEKLPDKVQPPLPPEPAPNASYYSQHSRSQRSRPANLFEPGATYQPTDYGEEESNGLQNLSPEKIDRLNQFAGMLNTLDDATVRRILAHNPDADCPTCGREKPDAPPSQSIPNSRPSKHASRHTLETNRGERHRERERSILKGQSRVHSKNPQRMPSRKGKEPRRREKRGGGGGGGGGGGEGAGGFWKTFVSEWGSQTHSIGANELVGGVTESELEYLSQHLQRVPLEVCCRRVKGDHVVVYQ